MNDPLLPFPHCGRIDCRCPHAGYQSHQDPDGGRRRLGPGLTGTGCVAGWIETTITSNGYDYEAVKPCGLCRGDRLPYDEERADGTLGRARWQERLRSTNIRTAHNRDEDW